MKVGIATPFGPHTPPAFAADVGRMIEERDFHSVWVPEHVLFFSEYASSYPYSKDGRIPGNPSGALEPFVALTWLAAHTQRIRLATGICLVPQRSPVYTAKQVADLDFLSGGRVDFGVGIGWLREEFQALGIPWKHRGARTLESIDVMKTLWCDEVSSFDGRFYQLPPCLQNPKPVQKPHPPIYFGGESDAALARSVAAGDGWYGFQLTPEAAAERIETLARLGTAAGRARADILVCVGARDHRVDEAQARRYADVGVDQLVIPVVAGHLDKLAALLDSLAPLVDVAA